MQFFVVDIFFVVLTPEFAEHFGVMVIAPLDVLLHGIHSYTVLGITRSREPTT